MTQNNQILLPQITHDLRNYIGGISGLVSIISDNINIYLAKQEASGISPDKNLKEISECANILTPYSNEALCYVEDLLNNAQMQSGQFTLGKLEECDVGELIKELLVFNQSFIAQHQIIVETYVDQNIPKLKTDILRLKQILINLITNAVKYSPQGNKVEIVVKYLKNDDTDDSNIKLSTSSLRGGNADVAIQNNNHQNLNQNSQLQITISDSGIGMTKAEIEMALNGYGQNIDKSNLNKPIDSHGLGMPIVKQLVELLGAKMEIESEKNKGTKVTICFL